MRKLLFFLFGLLAVLSIAQAQSAKNIDHELTIKTVQAPNGDVQIVASNTKPFVVSVKIMATYKGLLPMRKLPFDTVLPANATNFLLFVFKPTKGEMELSSNFQYVRGDVNAQPTGNEVYVLPFDAKAPRKVGQGYNGKFSHRGIKAIDFDMPVGTPVFAARGGVVAEVVQNYKRGCSQPTCKGTANFVVIIHDDGTLAKYVHLKHKGAKVTEGDHIKSGQLLGYSGNTGWSSGPHLHFEVLKAGFDKPESLSFYFTLPNGKRVMPKQGDWLPQTP